MRMNNKQKMFDNKQRFSFRKLTVGLASVLLGLTFMTMANTNQVQASEQAGTTQSAGTQTTGDSDVLEKPSQPVHKDDDLHISDNHTTQDQTVSSLSDGHDTQDLGNGKDTTNNDQIKPVDSNSAVSNTGEQLTPKETPVNKNNLSTVNNSESKVTANAAPAAVATGSNTDNPADQANEVQSQNSNKVRISIRSRRAVTSALTAQDVINWDAVQYRKQADGNVDITGWDIDKGGIDILLPNTWDFTQKGIISDGKQAEITSDVMGNIAEASNTKAKAENKTYNVKISENGDGKLIAKDQDWSYIFSNKISIGNSDIDRATKLESANLNNLDTSNVTDMSHMFDGASSLQSLDVSEWDTHNVTDMLGMFSYANSLQSLDISKWDTGSVTDMRGMFSDASRLQRLDVSKWDTHNVTNMWYMFSGASSLQSLDVSKWDTSNVTDVSSMFSGANSLQSLDVSKWDTSKVTNMSSMFADAKSLQSLDVSNWNTSHVTDMSNMFDGANRLQSLDVSKWDTSDVTDMNAMFSDANSLQSLDVSKWDTSNVINTSYMFYRTSSLQNLDVSKWNTSNVTNMRSMFANASARSMSANASSLRSLDVSSWDTHNVTDMSNMFYGTSSLQSLDVSNWNTSKVTNMGHMFDSTSSLQSLDVSSWDTHNVTSMSYMFRSASSLQSLDISNWDTTNVIGMSDMFRRAGSANGLVITANNYQGTPVPGASDTRKLAIISNVKDHFTDVSTWGNRPKTLTVMVHDETTHTDHEETVELDTIAYDSPEALRNAIQKKLTAFKNSKTDKTHVASDPILTSDPANLAQELNATYKIDVELSKIHIDPDHPVNPGEPIQGTKDKTYPGGLTHDDLNKTVTREVTIIDPTGKKSTTTQTVTFTRGATVDIITNKVIYDAWSENGKHTFDKVDVPTVTGYTTSSEVPELVVTPDTPSSTVNITYTANEAHQRIHYVDENGNDLVDPKDATGNDLNDGTVTGVTDETVSVPVPDGWDLVDTSDSTTTLTNPDTNGEVTTKTVKIKHGTIVVDHTDPHDTGIPVDPNKPNGPKYDGVTDQDLNQDAIRRFVFHLPANTNAEDYAHTFTQTDQTKVTWDSTANTVTVTQTVGFYRDAIVDKITGKVVGYKAKDGTTIKLGTEHDHGWIPADKSNGRFEAITFKQIKGYTPSVKATGPKKSINMMVKPALFRTAMFYNISFFANATFEKPEEKEIPKKAGNQDVIPSNKTTGKDTKPAKYVPKDPIQNVKDDPVKPTDDKGTSSNLPQKPEAKLDQKPDTKLDDTYSGKSDNTNPVTSSGKDNNTPSTPVDNTSKSDASQKQGSEVKTDRQKPIDNIGTVPAEKNVKKHANMSAKRGVKKTAKATENASIIAVTPVAPAKKQAPISDAKADEVVSTTATVKALGIKSGEKTLPQTGNKDDANLIALGVALIAFPGFVGLLVLKKKRDEA